MKLYKLLAVDDDPAVLDALVKALESEYKVFSASDGQNALGIMEEEDIALVISDHKMTGMTGVELMEELAKQYPDTVRMIITGYVEDALLVNAINVGHIYGFIAKPWKIKELRDIVKKGIRHYEKTQMLREPHVRTLLQGGIISMEQLESAISAYSESEKSIGEILVELRIIPASELRSATKRGNIDRKEIHEVLIERGLVSEDDLKMARQQQKLGKKNLTSTLTDLGYADEDHVLTCYALHLGMPYIPLTQFPKNPELAKVLPSRLAYEHTIVPVDAVAQTIVMAASEPLNEKAKHDIETEIGKRITVLLANRRDIKAAHSKYYGNKTLSTDLDYRTA